MSCIVVDIELSDKINLKQLGIFFLGNVGEWSFGPPKSYKPSKKNFWCRRKLHQIVWNNGILEHIELQNIFPEDVNAEFFPENTGLQEHSSL